MSGAPSTRMPGGCGSTPSDSQARRTGATSPRLAGGSAGDTPSGTFWRHPSGTFHTRLELPRLEQSASKRPIKRPLKLPQTATSQPRRGRPRTFEADYVATQSSHLVSMWQPRPKFRRTTSPPRFGATSNVHHKKTWTNYSVIAEQSKPQKWLTSTLTGHIDQISLATSTQTRC